jgi:hypothetical protein
MYGPASEFPCGTSGAVPVFRPSNRRIQRKKEKEVGKNDEISENETWFR